MRRLALAIPVLAAAFAVAVGVTLFFQHEDASSGEPTALLAEREQLLRSGASRHEAWLRAELTSLRAARHTGDRAAVTIHGGRVAAAQAAGAPERPVDARAVAREAAQLLSLDARGVGTRPLLELEAHAMGAGLAFDGVRDALWETADKGLVGSIDERIALLRDELDRHRRGASFTPVARITGADRRRLAGALDALAYRLGLAADRLAA